MLTSETTKNSFLTDDQIEAFFDTPRKQRKEKRKKAKQNNNNQPLLLKEIKPLTRTQRSIFESFFGSEQNLFLHGYAGTGKSFISSYLLMRELEDNPKYKKLKIVRSTVPSRDQGFLPGNAAEKAKIYEMPYHSIFADLYNRPNAYDTLKRAGKIEFESTSYLRGTTWNDTLVLLDEFQNGNFSEIMTVLTRVGENCRIIISGDFRQTDLSKDSDKKGILDIIQILKKIKSVDFFEFKKDDIVRSGFVKQLILAEAEYRKYKF